MIDEPALLDPPMEGALHEGRQLHLAIATPKGLHVTPTLYALGPGRLWFFAASATVKARQIATGDRGGALVRAGARSVVVTGRLERLDLMAPNQLAGAARAVPGVPQAVLGYAARNAADLLGFALDTAAGRGGRGVPPRRILISLVPDRVALLDGDVLVEARGAWPGSAGDERRMRLGRPVASGSQTPPVPSVLAWAGPDGPLALPAHWS
ncbi:MAG: pyridoxamine 5'-phosphate oxidase family protein, partial [Actinomycetota bacterium]|nr:pyridoxamine 5'-phosphate oxidase family protein [Actinomycetota bacterium]